MPYHLISLPLYTQRDNFSCGFISTLCIIKYFRPHISPLQVWQWTKTTHEGTDQENIIAAFKKANLKVKVNNNAKFFTYQAAAARKNPAIVYDPKYDHWSVMAGTADGKVLVYCPERGYVWYRPHQIENFGIFVERPATKRINLRNRYKKL